MADAQTEMILALRTEFDAARKDVRGMKDELGGLSKQSKNTGDSFASGLMPSISKAGLAAGAAALAFKGLQYSVGLAIQKQTKLAEFSAITGVTGEKLEAFGDAADQLAIKFGGSALDNIESFKGVLSKLGPGFASSSEAVKLMGENINVLAKASGLEAPAAMDALTTAMNQYNVDLKDPIAASKDAQYMMNAMAAAAQQGSAEIPDIAAAMKVSGSAAHMAGLSFAEYQAAIQVAAKAGLMGAEGGTALRNVLVRLQAPTNEAKAAMSEYGIDAEKVAKLLSGPGGLVAAQGYLKQKFEAIAEPHKKAALLNKIYGESAQSLGGALQTHIGLLGELKTGVDGTNTAQDMSAKIMGTVSERWNTVTSKVDVYAEKVGKLLLPVIEGITSVIDEFISKIEKTGEGFGKLFEGDFKGAWDSFTGSADRASGSQEKFAKSMRNTKDESKGAADASKKLTEAYRNESVVSAELKAAQKGMSEAKNAGEEARYREQVRRLTKEMERFKEPTKKAAKEVKTLADIIKERYDAGEQAILMRRLFGEPSAMSAASALQDVSNKLTAMQRPVSEMIDGIQEVNVAPPDWAAIFAADELEEIQKMVDSDVFKLAATAASEAAAMIGGAIGGADMSWKDMLKSILGSMMSFVQVEFLAAKAAAAIRALFTSGVSLTTDLALSALAYGALEVAKGAVNSFRSGIQYVPYDQMAMLHQGEQVKTKEEVQSERRGKSKVTQVHFSKFRAPMDDYYITRGRDVR